LRNRYHRYRTRRAVRSFRPSRWAPYPVRIYSDFLAQVKAARNVRIVPFLFEPSGTDRHARVYVRHDADTALCMQNLPLLLDVDRGLAIPTSVFLRVDGEEYALAAHRTMIERYRAGGVEFGLHTVCYLSDDYMARFRDETRLFSDALGFRPKAFTVHGLGAVRAEARSRFSHEIKSCYRDLGYQGSDDTCFRSYDYVIHDCHLDEHKSRFMFDDFLAPPRFLARGRNYVVLTHPCYWQLGEREGT